VEFRGERILKWTLPGVGAAFNCHCLFGGAGKSCGLTSIRQNGRQQRTRGICQSPIWTWQIGVLANPFDVNRNGKRINRGRGRVHSNFVVPIYCGLNKLGRRFVGQCRRRNSSLVSRESGNRHRQWLNSFFYAVSLFCCFAVPGLINLRQFQSNAKFAENEELKAERK
jgi:hypothetical protein